MRRIASHVKVLVHRTSKPISRLNVWRKWALFERSKNRADLDDISIQDLRELRPLSDRQAKALKFMVRIIHPIKTRKTKFKKNEFKKK